MPNQKFTIFLSNQASNEPYKDTPMKTLALDDRLYSALQEYADASGRPINELAAEAIESWLFDDEPDEAELVEIEAAEREYQEKGGMEAGEFFRALRKERGWE